ncbi:hypothetical protein FS837_012708 [Tulasnella sp. UAMH 9824]|nr:hypothetical protein FS837_012708 [Tulasnella sp. UAMH 9824]
MATRPNAAATSQALTLLGQFTDSIDSLPHDLTKAFGDLRELDAVLRSSMQGITSKVYKLIDLMQDSSATPAARLCLLLEIAEDAQRLRMGSEDKIRVAGRTADDVAAHNQYNHQILNHLSELDTAFEEALYIRRTTFPHVAPANLLPPTGEYALGRRGRRGLPGGVAQSTVSIGARLSAPMALSASAGGDKNKKRRLEEEEARRTPVKGKEKDQRMAAEKEREAAADSRKAKKVRTQRSPSPDDSTRPHGNRNFDQQYPPSAPAPNGYPHHQPQSHHHTHHTHHSHHGHSHPHHKSSTHIPAPQNSHGYPQPQPPYAPAGPYPPHSMPSHDAKHTVKPARTSSLLDVVANRPNDYAHHRGFASSPAFEPDDYEPMDRSSRRSGADGMRGPGGSRGGGSYPNGNGYGATPKEGSSGRGAPNDSASSVLTGNANANGNGEPGDDNDSRTYCYCDRVSYGEMIGCDDDQCRREWFHLGCLGMTAPPKGEWVCDECKARRAGKKSGRSRGGASSRPNASNTTPNGSAPPPNGGSQRASVPPQQPMSRNSGGK